ncbi:MAG: hypothetical protein J0L82_14905 [Deltaproteobacteria bacterium]|nr:hypothetical protein [Deltaproteobacteria bacterium]
MKSKFFVSFASAVAMTFLAVSSFASDQNSSLEKHQNADGRVIVWAVGEMNSRFKDGSYDQFEGIRKSIIFQIGAYPNRLGNSPIRRVGFQGTAIRSWSTGTETVAFNLEKAADQGKNLIWEFSFNTRTQLMGQSSTTYKGAFFVETQNGIYYWLKNKDGKDFEFGADSSIDLASIE